MSKTEVVDAAVAILLRQDGCVLLGQRPEGKSWAGWWEFPGGKIEAGESAIEALQREMQEELGTSAMEVYPWLTRRFAYPERSVKLHFFIVRKWTDEPHGREGQQISWQHPDAMTVSPLLPANEPVLDFLRLPASYGITNLAETEANICLQQLKNALDSGLKMIQVREKQLDAGELKTFAQKVIALAKPYEAKVLINTDIALAYELGADGVHLNAGQLMQLQTRPEGLLCGASCHNAAERAQAEKLAMDFAVLSPVMPTRSHPGIETLGWEGFRRLVADCSIPVYALGGLQVQDLIAAWNNGAHGIAMQRAVWSAAG
jgi:8-oxo-dGTP diphosphatase